MDFTDKYISASDNTIKPNLIKVEISNEAFAIGEMIGLLIKKLEHIRVDNK